MVEDLYYIVLINRYYRHECNGNDFHLEKIFSKDKILEIIEAETPNSKISDFLIITNDDQLLSKFIFCINESELLMLCRFESFSKSEIRINKYHFTFYDKIVYEKYIKIKNNDILSANMLWSSDTIFPYDDPSIGIYSEYFVCWVENKTFIYFETPVRYRRNNENEVFSYADIKKAGLKTFERLLNINILEIGNEFNQSINWEYKNDYLKYYDKVSCRRLYITKELLDKLKVDNEIEFVVETKLDKNYYIEYYVKGIYKVEKYIRRDTSLPDHPF